MRLAGIRRDAQRLFASKCPAPKSMPPRIALFNLIRAMIGRAPLQLPEGAPDLHTGTHDT